MIDGTEVGYGVSQQANRLDLVAYTHSKTGQIIVRPGLSQNQLEFVLRHELVHQEIVNSLGPIGRWVRGFATKYTKTYRLVEESVAIARGEGVAPLRAVGHAYQDYVSESVIAHAQLVFELALPTVTGAGIGWAFQENLGDFEP